MQWEIAGCGAVCEAVGRASPGFHRYTTTVEAKHGVVLFPPLSLTILSPPTHRRSDDPKVQRELAFFERVHSRLRSRDGYADFLKCLNLFAEDVISKAELVSLVHDIIGKHSDLLAGFNEFLMRCELGPEDPYSRTYARGERSRVSLLFFEGVKIPTFFCVWGTWGLGPGELGQGLWVGGWR